MCYLPKAKHHFRTFGCNLMSFTYCRLFLPDILHHTTVMAKRIAVFLLFASLAYAQVALSQQVVTGKIFEQGTNESIPGVTIKVKEQPSVGAQSQIDGSFSMNLPSGATALVFSVIGYKTLEYPMEAGAKEITVYLESDAQSLNEVVVTALGIKRQKRELGYATEQFSGTEVLLSNAPNVVNALGGKSAGVLITNPNGVDGGTTRIVIRGNNSIDGNNQPLIVVDGVPLENQPGLTDVGRGRDWGSAINNINPNDIEDINILKGPTAAALYGARGANGVVLITTKRGTAQEGIGITYNVNHKVVSPYFYRDVQNTFGAGGPINLLEPDLPKNAQGQYIYPTDVHAIDGPYGRSTFEQFGYYSTGASWGPRMQGQDVLWWDGQVRQFSPQPDNLKLFFDQGSTTSHNLSFSGGSKAGTVRVSVNRTGHDAIVPNSKFNQTSVNLGSRLNISPKLTADIAVSYFNYHRLNTPSLGDDNDASFGKGILYSWPRSYKGLEKEINILPDGARNDYGGKYPFTFSPPHLWWNTWNNNTTLDRNKLIGALTLTYQPLSWLFVKGRLGTDFTLNQFQTRKKPIDLTGITEGFYSNELGKDNVLNNDLIITATRDKVFQSPIGVSFSVGGTQWERNGYGIRAQTAEWENPWLYSLTNFGALSQAQLPIETWYRKRINSVFSFLNLSYENYAYLEMTARNDWSSALPANANSYLYPSISGSFIPTEAFDLKNNWLSFWKIRSAFAVTAADTDPYQVDFVYSTGTFGGQQTANLPGTIPPVALRPQKSNSVEIGTTLGLFRDKINVDFTYYDTRSYNQILNAPIPGSSGTALIRTNGGELRNKGLEASLNYNAVNRKHFFYKTGLNMARNRNTVVSLGDGAKELELANIWGQNGPAIVVREGESYGTIVGYDYVYHPDNGKPILNEDGTVYQISERRVPLGNATPDFTGGWTNSFGYKGFTISTLIDTKWGGDVYAGSYVIGLQTGQSPETLTERLGNGLPYTDPSGETRNIGVVLDGVYENGATNDKVVHYYYKYVGNTGGWGRFISKPGVLDNTWVKMREVVLSYQVPQRIAKKTTVFQGLTLSVTGRDLFYIYTSLPDNINPEGMNGAGNAQGLEWAAYPGTRSFTIGLNAQF
jgi:iron complex outermembrane recepter protein